MRTISIGNKLFSAFSVLLLLVAFIGVYSIHKIAAIRAQALFIETDWLPSIIAARKLQTELEEFRGTPLRHVVPGEEDMTKDLEAYLPLISNDDEKRLMNSVSQQWDDYLQLFETHFLALSRTGRDREQAAFLLETKSLFDSMHRDLTSVIALNEKGGVDSSHEGDQIYAQSRHIIEGVLLLSLLLGGIFSVIIGRSITRLIDQLRYVSLEVTSAATQLRVTSVEQASGATEQSSTVTELSATMEELSTTATLIAGNAQQITQAADATLKEMQSINEKVGTMTTRMIALGEKSQSIGSITSLIDSLADQTNLLALNAAIEAARAGEAGRGFAVVAAEIRKLAERSTESTKDIRTLITEIQTETNAVVMGMEGATKAVLKGLEQVGQTSSGIKGISMATQQQKSSAEQVVQAIRNVEIVTKEFAVSTRQTAESSEQLARLSENLKKSIGADPLKAA